MGDHQQTLTGPDFKKGVAVESLKPGQKLLGQVDGEPVLLIRGKDGFYAVGGKCSHYGANLDDGLVVDESIRCPWHHACFDVKTGEATKAPALSPLPTWKTEIRGEMVYVLEKIDVKSRTPVRAGSEHFVIVGSGAAGHAAAEKLRRLGFSGRLTVLSEDSDLPYDRPNLSKDYLAGQAPEEWMSLRSAEFYREQDIDLRLNAKVVKWEGGDSSQRFTLWDGEIVESNRCLIATGGRPVKPKIPGIEYPHVHFLRSFRDAKSLIPALSGLKKVVVIGAGFIGLEAASALRARGLDVTVVAPNEYPLERVVGREVGAFLKSVHENNGVRFLLRHTVERIEKSGVVLDDQKIEPAELILVAAGIQPNIELAQAGGVHCENGILVNQYLETNVKGVFAAGDVARWPSRFSKEPIRIEHWVVAQRQGQLAASNMMGLNVEYKDVPFFWSQQFDVILNYIGSAGADAEMQIHGRLADRDCAVSYSQNGAVRAVLTIGRDEQNLKLERAFELDDQELIRRILKE